MNNTQKILLEIKTIANEFNEKLYLLGIEIESNILKIKECNSIEAANTYFDLLQEMQNVLSELAFKYKFNMPNFLGLFIRDFERIDDHDLRKYMYQQIRSNNYQFHRKLL